MWIRMCLVSGVVAMTMFQSGCALFRMKVQDDDVNKMPTLDQNYGPQDLRRLAEQVSDEVAKSAFIQEQKDSPIMVIYGIQPRTTTFVDTQALTDRIRTTLISSSKIRFVNETRRQEVMKEQGFQTANATDETRVSVGKQLGAKYMLTGSLVEMQKESGRQVRVSKTELSYYQLTIEITDIETGIIAWAMPPKEFAREASKPLIGW